MKKPFSIENFIPYLIFSIWPLEIEFFQSWGPLGTFESHFGEIFRDTGGSRGHGEILSQAYERMRSLLRACLVLNFDLKVVHIDCVSNMSPTTSFTMKVAAGGGGGKLLFRTVCNYR